MTRLIKHFSSRKPKLQHMDPLESCVIRWKIGQFKGFARTLKRVKWDSMLFCKYLVKIGKNMLMTWAINLSVKSMKPWRMLKYPQVRFLKELKGAAEPSYSKILTCLETHTTTKIRDTNSLIPHGTAYYLYSSTVYLFICSFVVNRKVNNDNIKSLFQNLTIN